MNASKDFDVIIVGAGSNGLSAAATLAMKGKRVCVLEKSDRLGGMAQSRSPDGSNNAPRIAHLAYNLHPQLMKEFDLTGKIDQRTLPTIALSPDGKHIELQGGIAKYTDGSSHPDAEAYRHLHHTLKKFAALLSPLALRSPPRFPEQFTLRSAGELAALAKFGFDLKATGTKDLREFLRIVLSNSYDLIGDKMPDGTLAGSLAADSIWGAWAGPRSAGTVLSLLYRFGAGGNIALPIGGINGTIDAIATIARNNNADIRVNTAVQSLTIEDDRATGVVLEDGSRLSSDAVLSTLGALPSMMIAGVTHYDIEAVKRIRNMRTKGMTAKINLQLNGLPSISGLDQRQLAGRLLIAPSMNYIENAFNAAKYGDMPAAPVIEAVIPSLTDTSMQADGKHTLSVIVQYIPYHLSEIWSAATREKLAQIVMTALDDYMPGIKQMARDVETLSPLDIEEITGTPGGHWHHGELSTDQLLTVRPVNGMSNYAFGVSGYYIGGASAHPGGDVTGLCGRNSAIQLLKDGVLT